VGSALISYCFYKKLWKILKYQIMNFVSICDDFQGKFVFLFIRDLKKDIAKRGENIKLLCKRQH